MTPDTLTRVAAGTQAATTAPMDARRLMDCCVFPRDRVDLSVPQRKIVRTTGNTT